jgi:hypothetical protein
LPLVAAQLRRITVLGLPIHFLAVVVVSAALFVYLSGWAALARVEARSDSYHAAAFGEPALRSRLGDDSVVSGIDAEEQPWERMALFVCPLH